MSNHTTSTSFTVRLARPTDSRQIARLASLDSAAVPAGELVVAETGGHIVAALPVTGGPAIADPFVRTAALVEMLELRAGQLRAVAARESHGFAARLAAMFERPAVRVN